MHFYEIIAILFTSQLHNFIFFIIMSDMELMLYQL